MHKVIFVLLLLIPNVCYADGGIPILWIIGYYVFALGSIWMFAIEFVYFTAVFNRVGSLKNLKNVLYINLISGFIGTIVFPLFLGVITTSASQSTLNESTKRSAFDAGIDNLNFFSVGLWFLISFGFTVIIEYLLIRKQYPKHNILKHSIYWNFISYIGLIAFVIYSDKYHFNSNWLTNVFSSFSPARTPPKTADTGVNWKKNMNKLQKLSVFFHIASVFLVFGYSVYKFGLSIFLKIPNILSTEVILSEKVMLLSLIIWLILIISLVSILIKCKYRLFAMTLAILSGIASLITLPISLFTVFVLTRNDVIEIYQTN